MDRLISIMKRKSCIVLIITGIISICVLGLYVLGFVPNFATLPIDLPDDDFGRGVWSSTTYSIMYQFGPVFTWRKQGYVAFDTADGLEKLQFLREYYEHYLVEQGWITAENSEICNNYLPEAHLLITRQNGFMLQYLEEGKPVYVTGDYFGDLICIPVLAVDSDASDSYRAFKIIVFTVRPSPIKILLDYWSVLNY